MTRRSVLQIGISVLLPLVVVLSSCGGGSHSSGSGSTTGTGSTNGTTVTTATTATNTSTGTGTTSATTSTTSSNTTSTTTSGTTAGTDSTTTTGTTTATSSTGTTTSTTSTASTTDTGSTTGGTTMAHAFNPVDAGEGSPPFNWTYHVNADTNIPFVEYGFKVRANGSTGATAERTLGDPVCYALHVMQKFNFSPNIAQGTLVGRITVVLTDGTTLAQDLIAGVNTADFAYDKYLAQGTTPAHLKPATPYAQPTVEDGISYDIRHFYLRFDTTSASGAPRAVNKIVVEAFLNGLPSDFGIDLYGLTLEQAP